MLKYESSEAQSSGGQFESPEKLEKRKAKNSTRTIFGKCYLV